MTNDFLWTLFTDGTAVHAVVIFGVLLAIIGLTSKRGRRSPPNPQKRDWPRRMRSKSPEPDAPWDATNQLKIVMAADFTKRKLMSMSEARVFRAAETIVASLKLNWRVMAQVSLGEILSSGDSRAYAAINSKRTDILLITSSGEPVAAIEFQGTGHHQGTAAVRDAVKKEALRRAGIAYVEVLPDHDLEAHLRLEIGRLARQQTGSLAA